MFNSLRKSIAKFINPSDATAKQAQLRMETSEAYAEAIADKVAKRNAQKAAFMAGQREVGVAAPALAGEISADIISNMASEKGKQAVYQLAAWMSLSNAFQAYNTIRQSKRVNEKMQERFASSCNDFHQWNSRLEVFSTGLDVEETVARLTIPKVARSNPQTDTILARIKGISVTEVALEREIKAELEARNKEANAVAFITELEGFAFGEEANPSMKASMVVSKAEECLIWIAGWNNPDVAELLILEQDISMLKKAASEHRENEGDFIEGTMAADTLCRMNQR